MGAARADGAANRPDEAQRGTPKAPRNGGARLRQAIPALDLTPPAGSEWIEADRYWACGR